MRTSRIILYTGALIYFAFGFLFFLNPDAITTMDGIILHTRSSANHIRAPLGGMEIGLGFVLVFFALRKERVIYGLVVLSGSIGFASLAKPGSGHPCPFPGNYKIVLSDGRRIIIIYSALYFVWHKNSFQRQE